MRKGEGGAMAQGWSLGARTLEAGLGTEDSVGGECSSLGLGGAPLEGVGLWEKGGALVEGTGLGGEVAGAERC